MSSTSALIGAVIFAWAPEDENPYVPGPKFRPVIVLDADPIQKRLLVAKGTSQRVKQCGRGEITFTTQDIKGLSTDTKFKLGNSQWIPIEKPYLSKDKNGSALSVLGIIPAHKRKSLLVALEEINAFD